ncbi:ABC transporter permease [Streptomyces sp. SBT349]|uniref:ABC transporter permease n=1 Tax=Streptomyces sp. SBT349 TaxID=1580539 RepID=UPI00066C0ED8|nr:ABC transporter permease subunit [Streptomyces sp. SBT349]
MTGGPRRALPRPDLFGLLGLALTLAVLGFIAYPLASTIVTSFVDGGALDLTPMRLVLTDSALHRAARNTGTVLVTAGPLALLIGSAFAWLNERTDARLRWLSDLLPVVPLLLPPIALSIGWVFLADERAGFVNSAIRSLGESVGLDMPGEGPLNISTWPGLIFVYTISLVPYVYLIVSSALKNADPSLEEASRMSGAGVLNTLVRVSLPAIRPAVAAAALLVVIVGSSLYSIPRTIGTAARVDTISVYIVRLTQSFPSRLDEAVAVSLLVLVVMGALWLLQRRVSARGRHSTISGKAAHATVVRLGRWRRPARAVMIGYLLCVSVLPFLALALVALQPFWTAGVDLSTLTLDNFRGFFGDGGRSFDALRTSLTLGVLGATTGIVAVAVVITFGRDRGGVPARLVEGATKTPGAISHIVFGVALLVTFAGAPFYLSGTMQILLIAYVIIYLPQASTAVEVAHGQVGDELLEASRMSGASKGRTFRTILFPLMRPGLTAGWALLFVVMVGDLTASAILAGTTNPVVGFVFLDIWDHGTFSDLAALGTVVSLVTSVVVVLALTLGRSSRWQRRPAGRAR